MYEANYSHDDSNYQKQVNQPARYMKTPAEKPENNEDSEDGPKHSFAASRRWEPPP